MDEEDKLHYFTKGFNYKPRTSYNDKIRKTFGLQWPQHMTLLTCLKCKLRQVEKHPRVGVNEVMNIEEVVQQTLREMGRVQPSTNHVATRGAQVH